MVSRIHCNFSSLGVTCSVRVPALGINHQIYSCRQTFYCSLSLNIYWWIFERFLAAVFPHLNSLLYNDLILHKLLSNRVNILCFFLRFIFFRDKTTVILRYRHNMYLNISILNTVSLYLFFIRFLRFRKLWFIHFGSQAMTL